MAKRSICYLPFGLSKVALTVFAFFMATVQVLPEKVSQPVHPVKVEPVSGFAVSVTEVL